MKRLSNKIMEIERRSVTSDDMYTLGHDDAKHDACNMAMKYDDTFSFLALALEGLMELEARGRIMPVGAEWGDARAALEMVRNLDEHQKTEGEQTP